MPADRSRGDSVAPQGNNNGKPSHLDDTIRHIALVLSYVFILSTIGGSFSIVFGYQNLFVEMSYGEWIQRKFYSGYRPADDLSIWISLVGTAGILTYSNVKGFWRTICCCEFSAEQVV